MNPYSIIGIIEKSEDNKYFKLKKHLPRKIYLYYIKKYTKTIIKESEYLGEKGDIIMLPFTMEEFEGLDEKYRKTYIDKVFKKYDIKYLYAETSLSKIVRKIDETFIIQYNTILLYIMFPQIMERALKENQIDMKEMRLTIIDSGDWKIEYILELLINDLNHLTIITKRPEYFNEFVDIIYDNTGLVTEVISEFSEKEDSSDLIIDMSKDRYKYQKVVIIDMESDKTKRQYQYSRKKDACIIYDIMVCSGNQVVDNELLGFFLLRNHPNFRDFLEGRNNSFIQNSLLEISMELDLKLDRLKCF